MQDIIEREITIRASKERIFNAIVDPAQIVAWFPKTIQGEMREGQQPILGFGKYGDYRIHVLTVRPYDYLAFRWVPTVDPAGFVGDVLAQPNTLVEFYLTEEGAATLVKVTETGFAGLPEGAREKMFQDNTEGWEQCFQSLQEFLEK